MFNKVLLSDVWVSGEDVLGADVVGGTVDVYGHTERQWALEDLAVSHVAPRSFIFTRMGGLPSL